MVFILRFVIEIIVIHIVLFLPLLKFFFVLLFCCLIFFIQLLVILLVQLLPLFKGSFPLVINIITILCHLLADEHYICIGWSLGHILSCFFG